MTDAAHPGRIVWYGSVPFYLCAYHADVAVRATDGAFIIERIDSDD